MAGKAAKVDAKQVVAGLKKHYFWISCGLIAVVSMVVWFMACSGLRKQTSDRVSTIQSAFNTGEQVTRIENHPNPTSHEGTDALIRVASQEVYEAWLEQVNHQQAVLVWPQELGADLIGQVEDKWPIEKIGFPTDPKDDVFIKYRERYRNYVDYLLPKLAQTAGAKWHTDVSTKEPVVEWDAGNQRALLADHFSWPDQPSQAPSTLQMLYAQETLWALTELMQIVKRTNGDAEARYQAAIKRIYSIYLSQDAVARAGQVSRVSGNRVSGGGGGAGGAPGGMASGMPEGMPGGGGYGGGMPPGSDTGGGAGPQASGISGPPGGGGMPGTALAASNDPADYRYVDPKDFKPLTGQQIRNALQSDDPTSAFLVVAKRMPIRMRLNMDQRKLNRLLAEFGNSDLPVEIRQVRINRPPAPASGAGRPGGGGGGGGGMNMALGGDGPPGMDPSGGLASGPPMGGGMPGMPPDGGVGGMPGMGGIPGMGGGMPGLGGRGGGGVRLTDSSPYDVDVELWGLIYIYNPVDMDKLGIEKKGEEAAAEAEAQTTEVVPAEPAQPGVEPAQPGVEPAQPGVEPAQPGAPVPPPAGPGQPPAGPSAACRGQPGANPGQPGANPGPPVNPGPPAGAGGPVAQVPPGGPAVPAAN